jgi:hypothetical protein
VLEERLAAGEKFDVVALDYEIELEMKKRGIPFIPLRESATLPSENRETLEMIRHLSVSWYSSPELAFFQHEGILLGEPYKGPVNYYFGTLIYYLAIIEQLLARSGIVRVSIPQSFLPVSGLANPVDVFKESLPVDVARLLAERRGIALESISPPLVNRTKSKWYSCKTRVAQSIIPVAVRLVNAMVSFRKSRPIKLLATDPWYRLEPYVKNMTDVELIMTRRKEMKDMGWKNIWRTRAQFRHRLDFVDVGIRALAHQKSQEFARAWGALGPTPRMAASFEYQGISFWPLAHRVLGALVTQHAQDDIITIENTKRLLVHHRINCVLLFSSVKGYNNLIARVAESMDIPSIELQHAVENNEPSHPYATLHSRYLAAYGTLQQKSYAAFGVEPWRVIPCGSPRFDKYRTPVRHDDLEALRARLHLDTQYLNILVNVPYAYLSLEPEGYSTYDVQRTLEDYAELRKKFPKTRLLLRPRPSPWRNDFYNREETLSLFTGEMRMVQYDNLHALLTVCDIVISGTSTLVVESLIMQKPVIMYVPHVLDHNFESYVDAGAVLMARTKEELFTHVAFLSDERNRTALVERGGHFLRENFKFDGKASERVAALIRNVAKSTPV